MKAEAEGLVVGLFIFVLVGTIFSSSYAMAVTYAGSSAVSVKYQSAPSFQTLYGSNVNTYWPILAQGENCTARQDFLIQVAPFGCQPAVVRSDLLAEQDVPVFCQINALDINPLIKVEQIKNIDFKGQYPPEVSGVGFHPARAALRSQNTLLGSPTANNIGYVVVVLKRQPVEANLSDSVNVSLQAFVQYDANNAYGVGRSDFILQETTLEEWQTEKLKNSFWNGRYFLRLEGADENYADVSIYEGDRKAITVRVPKGQTSKEFYLPGMYCQAGLSVAYDSFVAAQKKARIEISSGGTYDSFDAYEGSNFFDGRCTIRTITINQDGETGRVVGSCASKQFVLELKSRTNSTETSSVFINGKSYPVNKIGAKYWIDLTNSTDSSVKGEYYFDGENIVKGDGGVFIINSTTNGTISSSQKTFFNNLYTLMKAFAVSDSGVSLKPEYSKYFDQAIGSYEKVADDYSSEVDGIYGKEALQKGINLAKEFGDDQTMTRLMNRYITIYPGDSLSETYKSELESVRKFDLSLSGEAIEFDNDVKVLRLVSLALPGKKAGADLSVQGQAVRLSLDSALQEIKDGVNGNVVGKIKLDKVDVDKVEIGAYCKLNNGQFASTKSSYVVSLDQQDKKICGLDVRLNNVDVERAVKVRVIPSAKGTRTETNISVAIGIEKRAIQLTPDKVAEKIENLNKTIQKWQKIADTLGKVISGLKGACFATATLLTFKNFMTGLDGESIARQQVMNGENGWKERCKALVANGDYVSMDACYSAKSSEIDSEVSRTTAAINKVNAEIKQVQDQHTTSVDLFGKSVDTEAVRKDLAQKIKSEYAGSTIDLGDKKWTNLDGTETSKVPVDSLLTDANVNSSLISTEQMRSLMTNLELQKQGSSLGDGQMKNINGNLKEIALQTNNNMIVNKEYESSKAKEKDGYPSVFNMQTQSAKTLEVSIQPLSSEAMRKDTGLTDPKVTHFSAFQVPAGMAATGKDNNGKTFDSGIYYLGLEGNSQTGIFTVRNVTKKDNPNQQIDANAFSRAYNLGSLKRQDAQTYQNEIQSSDRCVRYYETEPYKGMPGIVPFDTKAGWYAATQQTLPAFGGLGAFDASGRVTSFWICNVGQNGKVQFDSGFGDDLCQQVNLNTGQPLNMFPGLDSSKASSLVQRAQQAIRDASTQYKSGSNYVVSIGGERYKVCNPMVSTPSTQCQDFMSPKECQLMFNVCDPVVCPPSRCNFGGTYYVSNVAQTGIIGSIFLCLPNIREGILIPVCLTGIHAGIEGWISIMKNYRDCLQENLNTGKMVGICDQIYSIYLCEFFWNQLAPLVNVLIPKVIEMAYGQGVRGGAEYLSVQGAWQNMQNSIDYFTQSYAANSFEAFRARSTQEVGTEVCKAFTSLKFPTDFDSLLQPDSPPQFHGWFDEKTFTTATVPATSQYKVFYHIFAGNDQGVSYNVYLKNPPTSGYYVSNPTVNVASGFIAKGEYASQTKDFTAPQGYKELCIRINNDEECGFKQVSSSFAVNYLRDSYIKDEASKTTITSQKECVSGSNNPATLLTPNIQQGVEETISPELYNRGIVRVCASENPGSKTDPKRFVDVGYCDNTKIRCWIDQRSIEEAITQGNIGTLNETLEALDARTKALLDAKNVTLGDSEAENVLMLLKSKVKQLVTIDDALVVINQTNYLLDNQKLFWNMHKAQAYILRGDAQAYIATYYFKEYQRANPRQVPADDTGMIVDSGTTTSVTTVNKISGFIGSSINMFNKYDFDHCSEAVLRAKEKGAPAVNLAPTFYVVLNDNNEVQQYLFGDSSNGIKHVPFTKDIIDYFSSRMYLCMKTAYDNGMVVSTHPQLDIEPGSRGEAWRNGYVFNPTQKIQGYSYDDIMLSPLSNAALNLGRDAQIDFSMQGEMGGTLFDYPLEWKSLVDRYKSSFSGYPNARVGINLNFNTISGNKNDWQDQDWFKATQPTGPAHNRDNFQSLINSVQFIGFSDYEKTSNPTTQSDLYSHVTDWEDKFKRNGLTIPNVPWRFSEYGLGGGASVGKCASSGESPNRCPWEGSSLKEKVCPTLWAGGSNDLRYSYYKALVDFLSGGGSRVDSAYLWNLDTWDVQGLYKGLLDNSGPCKDDQIASLLKDYNSKYPGLKYSGGNSGSSNESITNPSNPSNPTSVCTTLKYTADTSGNIKENGVDTGLKVTENKVVSANKTGSVKAILLFSGGIYRWVEGIDLNSLTTKERSVGNALVGKSAESLASGITTTSCIGGTASYNLGDKTSFNGMNVEYVYVAGEKSQVYFSGGKIYVYSDTGQKEIGSYLPDNSKIKINSLNGVKANPGYFSIFDFANFYVTEKDLKILTTLKDGQYSYCDLGGKDCGSSEALTQNSNLLCESACSGVFGCSKSDCIGKGNCYFVDKSFAKNECHSCVGATCSSYPDETTCGSDMCGLSCAWSSTDEMCVGSKSEILLRSGKTPCFDAEQRLKADFGDIVGSYGLNPSNRLEWYLSGTGWIDIRDNPGAGWKGKTPQLKEWAIQLERELLSLKNSGKEIRLCSDTSFNPDNVVLVYNENTAELTFNYKQPSGLVEDFNLRVEPDKKSVDNKNGVELASLNKNVGGIVAGAPVSLIGLNNYACISVLPGKAESNVYGTFKAGVLNKSKIVRVKQSGNDQYDLQADDGSCNVVEQPFALKDMFELVESANTVKIYFKSARDSPLKDTGLYINLNEGGGKVIKNTAGPAVGSLSESIAAMRAAGLAAYFGITNEMGIVIDGNTLFNTSCLNGQQIIESDGKLKISFVNNAASGCPTSS